MVFSMDKDKPLCPRCKHEIELFGAHRGGVYCQAREFPQTIQMQKLQCPCFESDNGLPHKRKFEYTEYTGLLSSGEREFIAKYGYDVWLKRNGLKRLEDL